MKKLLKWVFPAILGIVPAFGMDNSDKDFLSHPLPSTYTCGFVDGSKNIDGMLELKATVTLNGEEEREIPVGGKGGLGSFTATKYANNDELRQAITTYEIRLPLFQNTGGLRSGSLLGKYEDTAPYIPSEPKEVFYVDGAHWKLPTLPTNQLIYVYEATEYVSPIVGLNKETHSVLDLGQLLNFLYVQANVEIQPNQAICTHCPVVYTKNNPHILRSCTATTTKKTTYRLPLDYPLDTLVEGSKMLETATMLSTTQEKVLVLSGNPMNDNGSHNIKAYLSAATYLGTQGHLTQQGWVIQ